jgi:hypothetical protein
VGEKTPYISENIVLHILPINPTRQEVGDENEFMGEPFKTRFGPVQCQCMIFVPSRGTSFSFFLLSSLILLLFYFIFWKGDRVRVNKG